MKPATLFALFDAWLAEQPTKSNKDAASMVRKHVVAVLGDQQLSEVSTSVVADAMHRGYAALPEARSRYKLSATMKKFVKVLAEAGAPVNVAALPWHQNNPRVCALTEKQVVRLEHLEHLADFLTEGEWLFCQVMYWLALRPGQVLALQVGDLNGHEIAVEGQRRQASQDLVSRLRTHVMGRPTDAPLIVGPKGGNIHTTNLNGKLRDRAYPALGLEASAGLEALREGRAVDLLTEGTSYEQVAAILGLKQQPHFAKRFAAWL
ncbi:MAG: hypothetical protein JWP14_390 [Frankiales bacterium]|nr:hypothetical protein [Frankiales bacterium]